MDDYMHILPNPSLQNCVTRGALAYFMQQSMANMKLCESKLAKLGWG